MPGIGWRLRVEAKAVLCLRDFAKLIHDVAPFFCQRIDSV